MAEGIVACNRIIGADTLGYLETADLPKLLGDSTCTGCCTACFTGEYATEIPANYSKMRFEGKISKREMGD